MNAMQQFEHIRFLELENKNLRAALIGAHDNLRDAEVELGRLRVEIKKVRTLLDRIGLPVRREYDNPGFPMSLLGTRKVVPIGSIKDPAFHPMPADEQGLTEADKRHPIEDF